RGTLLDIARATTSTLDMAEVLKLVTQRAAQTCGADRCTILLLDEEGKTLTPVMSQFASGRVDEKMGQLFKDTRYPRPLAEAPEAQQVLQDNCPLFIPDALASSLPRDWIESFNVKSLLIVPMISKGRPIGALALDHTEEGKEFAAEQVNLAMTIGAQAAIAIENVQLYDAAQRELAERKWAEEVLKQTMAELERSNKELEQFAYVASHDLREPLRMVTSYVQLLARRYQGKLDADADDFIAYAVDGATRMQALINDLLAYSRVGTRGKPFEPTDCEAVFEQALTNLQVAIEESGAAVTHDLLPTVMADATQLTQLFQNLIGNAIKFRSEEPPRVHISVNRQSKIANRKSEWVFSVRDNGIGIDPEYHERIFLLFQRLHTREEYPGTGIGLAVCKKIVERHGGRIWVESQPGKGSIFYFTIPVISDQ
ncbi:MAG: ATP-binding protein, partial [Anaerolineae bacterium]